MSDIILLTTPAAGANHADEEARVFANLKHTMRGKGGLKGLSVRYVALQDKRGQWKNFGDVQIVADNETAAKRYWNAREEVNNHERH
jgi:hypothetical protein